MLFTDDVEKTFLHQAKVQSPLAEDRQSRAVSRVEAGSHSVAWLELTV